LHLHGDYVVVVFLFLLGFFVKVDTYETLSVGLGLGVCVTQSVRVRWSGNLRLSYVSMATANAVRGSRLQGTVRETSTGTTAQFRRGKERET